jgi:hypothetical protein
MRSTLLLLPLVCLAGCMSDTARAEPAAASPTAKAPAPAAAAPVVTAPVVAPAPVAAPPATRPVTADLSGHDGGRIAFFSGGAVEVTLTGVAAGDYDLAINAGCDEADGQKAIFTVSVDGQQVGGEVTCTTTEAREYVVKAPGLKAGDHQVAITFLNDLYKENEYDLNLYVHGVALRPAGK